MSKILQIALGVIAAVGGYVDIGDIVFNSQAGASVGYRPLWAVPIGVLGIIIFAVLSGRVAAVGKKATFDLVRDQYPRWLSTVTLVFALLVTLITLAAELGGLGFVLHYVLGWNEGFFTLLGVLLLAAASIFLSFGAIERIFGYLGLGLVAFAVAAFHHGLDLAAIGQGFVPSMGGGQYWYFVVGLMAAAFMPYEIYFFSSGAIEEGWSEDELGESRANAVVGYPVGGLLAVALTVVATQQLLPAQVSPSSLGTVLQEALRALGPVGFYAAVIGAFFAIGGATIDTAFSCAYNLAQHQRWKWGKKDGLRGAPLWTATLLAALAIGYAVVQTRVNPVMLTEYAVIASVVAMPLSFWPLVRASQDPALLGDRTTGVAMRGITWMYFGLICVLAVAAPILMVVTHTGEIR